MGETDVKDLDQFRQGDGIGYYGVHSYNIYMVVDYIHWQYVTGPLWILNLFLVLEKASLRLFSVKLLVSTLFSYWHKDAMSWSGGTISQYVFVIGWNIISRLIGFAIRGAVLLGWLFFQVLFIPLTLVVLLAFMTWPLLVIIGVSTGLSLFVI